MSALTQILAPTDFSPLAGHATERAARLAHECGAALTLLHVLPRDELQRLRDWLGTAPGGEAALRAQAQAELERLAQTLRQQRQARVQTELCEGLVAQEVLRAASAQAAELLVLGARGSGFWSRFLQGSTAKRLLYSSPLPLLLVRQHAHSSYRRVLVAVDFSAYTEPTLRIAQRVAPHAAQVLVVHAFQVPFRDKMVLAGVEEATMTQYRQHARQRALDLAAELARRWFGERGQPLVVEGEAWQRLTELEQREDCDLVVLGKQGQSALQDALLGSVTQHLVAEGQADLLVVPH